MKHFSDTTIETLFTPEAVQQTLLHAWQEFGRGAAAMQPRVRTEVQGVKLSTLGAIIPAQKVVGAKVYTTINGQFSFVVLLFSSETGECLASFDAAALTRWRTAACSVIAARYLANQRPGMVLAILGMGQQGRAHLQQMAQAFPLRAIHVHDPFLPETQRPLLAAQAGVPVHLCSADDAVIDADIVVTASRSAVPLFKGEQLKQGAFVAAIGSSLPTTRELDDAALGRAKAIILDWTQQCQQEAGDIVLADPALRLEEKLIELGQVVLGKIRPRQSSEDIIVYKSVGVGLQDVALAGLAWRTWQAHRAG